MKCKRVIALFVGTCVALCASIATAQEAPALFWWLRDTLNPG